MVFCQNGGGREVYINNQLPSAIMCFFKWACKTIIGPPKHVLHLAWSVYVRHYRLIFHQKNEEKKFHRKISQKRPNRGAGVRGVVGKRPDFFWIFFLLPSLIQFYSDRYKYSDFSALKDSTTNSNASRSLCLHFVHWSDDHGLFVVVKVVNDLFSMLEELFKSVRHWAVNSSLREIQLHNYWIDNSATFK